MGRFIHTFRCGEVGMQGTRRVLEGGRIVIGGSRGAKHMTWRYVYADPRLMPYVGQIVYFIDDDSDRRVTVYEVTFDRGQPGTRGAGRNRSVTGDFICYARQVANEPGQPTPDAATFEPDCIPLSTLARSHAQGASAREASPEIEAQLKCEACAPGHRLGASRTKCGTQGCECWCNRE